MTPASTLAAADKINRSKSWRCLNCTGDHPGNLERGLWRVSRYPAPDHTTSYYLNHAGLEELAKTIEEEE